MVTNTNGTKIPKIITIQVQSLWDASTSYIIHLESTDKVPNSESTRKWTRWLSKRNKENGSTNRIQRIVHTETYKN